MKKGFFALIIAVSCCLAGCSSSQLSNSDHSSYSSEGAQSSDDSQSSQQSSELTNISTPYTVENLTTILFTDVDKALSVEVTANMHLQALLLDAVYYTNSSESLPDDQNADKYVLSLQGLDLFFKVDGTISFVFADNTAQQAVVLQNEFAYLDTFIETTAVSFDGYTAEQSIKVYDAENKGGTVTNKEDFLQNLRTIHFVKLNNKDHYQLGAATHSVRIDNDELTVYSKYITLNGELYSIYQGDFAFLSDVQFSTSSGWLPWL